MKSVKFQIKGEKKGIFQALSWNAAKNHDSCWALHVGTDGKVYFSSCSEGQASSACLLCYDVEQNRLDDLLDIGELSGDLWNSGRVPQSKIHTCLRETSDGYLYGVSHCTAPNFGAKLFEVNGTLGDSCYGYRGAQMFRVKMATGEAEYVGLAIPFEGCRNMEIVEEIGKAYLVSYPRHTLYEFDLARRLTRKLGRIGTWGGCDIFQDAKGRIYGSYDDGRFYRYLPKEDRFEDLAMKVPGIKSRRGPYNFFFNVKKFHDDFVCATGYFDGHLFKYNPEVAPEGVLEDLGAGWLEEWDGKAWTPPYVQAPVLCLDRWLYYGCNTIWQPTHLMRMDLETGAKESLGIIQCDGLTTAWLSEGGISKDGRMLFFAEVNMKAVPRVIMVKLELINKGKET
jgi:hypothetical protein